MSATMLCDGTLPLGWLPRIPRGSHWYRQQTRSRYLIKIILGIKYILLSKVIYHLQSFKSKWAILYLIYLMIFGIDFSFYTFLALRPTCKFIIVHYFLPYFAYILPNSYAFDCNHPHTYSVLDSRWIRNITLQPYCLCNCCYIWCTSFISILHEDNG